MAAVSRRLVDAFSKVTRDLDAIGAKYAVIGGLAVGARVEPRTTKDIDFAVDVADDAAAEALIFALSGSGYRVSSVFQSRQDDRIATVRTHGRDDARILIDYLFASTRIEGEIVSSATRQRVYGVEAPVARLGHLLAMKVKANRRFDAIDIHNLIGRANAADLREARGALRLMQARGAEPGRDLVGDLRRLVAEEKKPGDFAPITGAALRRFQRRPQ